MKRIGIITWHYYPNYGSHLQAFALKRYLSLQGYDVFFINFRDTKFGKSSRLKKYITGLLLCIPQSICQVISKKLTFASYRFEKKYIPQTSLAYNQEQLRSLANKFDTIICGSDQIWAPNVFNPIYMLNFVPDDINKVSYAASIGLEHIPEKLVEDYKKYIGRINHVSIREDKGKEILKSQCGIDATVVLDPTLLLAKAEWDKIKKPSKLRGKYIFCYFLKADHQYKELVKEYAIKNGYKIYGVSDSPDDLTWMNCFNHQIVGPCEFIGLIEGAEGVFTDSYHGAIFSMIYHKSFTLFERFNSSDKICQNSRIEQLKKYFGIDENVVRAESLKTVELNSIDYDSFEKSLASLREHSASFLNKALK